LNKLNKSILPTTITSKGQVTIPKEIRDKFGLKPSDRAIFKIEGDKLNLPVPRNLLPYTRMIKISISFLICND